MNCFCESMHGKKHFCFLENKAFSETTFSWVGKQKHLRKRHQSQMLVQSFLFAPSFTRAKIVEAK